MGAAVLPAVVSAAPNVTPKPNKNHYAIVVGINVYPHIRDLRAARSDALAMAEWLRASDGGFVPAENVHLIEIEDKKVKRAAPQPTRERVNDALQKVIDAQKAMLRIHPADRDSSRLYLYFSGHGVSASAEEAFFLMANASSERPGENIACMEYTTFFRTWGLFAEVVTLADCCRTANWLAKVLPSPWVAQQSIGSTRKMLAYATTFNTLAFEPTLTAGKDPDQLRGYFTQALLEGLRGAAADGSGAVDSVSLSRYIKARVLELTKSKLIPQVTDVMTDPGDPIVFRRGVPPAMWTVTITFEPGTPNDVGVYDGSLRFVSRCPDVDAAWKVTLPNGVYQVKSDSLGTKVFAQDGIFHLLGDDRDVKF